MAVSKKKSPTNKSSANKKPKSYAEIKSRFQSEELGKLYLLYGEETYLINDFAAMIRKKAFGDEVDGFNLHRLNGPSVEFQRVREGVDALPFLSDHTLVELWNVDVNMLNTDEFRALFKDVPDWCTVVVRQPSGIVPKGNLGIVQDMKKNGFVEEFAEQPADSLSKWISKRFAAEGHTIGSAARERLCFLSGKLMTGLIPEIEKISTAVTAEEISVEDVERYAHHIPEAKAYEMANAMADGNVNKAASLMGELLESGQEPIMVTALLASQYRSLYAAKIFQERRMERDSALFGEITGKYGYGATVTFSTAKKFSKEELREDVRLCANMDYLLKSDQSVGEEARMAELLIRLTMNGKTSH